MIKIDHFLATAGCGLKDELQDLLDKGAQINGKNAFGLTALMMAAQNGHVDAVKFLLSTGADVNAEDQDGDTALKLATLYGPHPEVQALLLKAGAAKLSIVYRLKQALKSFFTLKSKRSR